MSAANTNNHDIDATVTFPVPTLDGNTIENEPIKLLSKDPTNYMSFHVTVNGQAVAPKVEVRAFKNGKEISARLRALGLPLSVLDPNLRSSAAKLSPDHPKNWYKTSGSLTKALEMENLPATFGLGGTRAFSLTRHSPFLRTASSRYIMAIDLWSVAAISRRIRTENIVCSRTVEMPTPWIECVNLHWANEQKT